MATPNQQVADYIAKSPAFAQPILEHLLQLIHDTCPEVKETVKWGIPHLDYKGEMMCILAAYKQHCSFTFWKAPLMRDPRLQENAGLEASMRFMGKIKSLSDLPPDAELVAFIKEAMVLNENGIKLKPQKPDKPETVKVLEVPDYFAEKLAANPAAKEIFETKPSSFQKDYLIWIIDAKTEATRQARMEQSLAWITEGKGRFWKYQK
jgi:uncharacterized protein YdeI (YjbR/CyaY-like superfamily)